MLATSGKFFLSSLLPGALTGAAAGSKLINKISGSAIYVKKGGSVCKIVPQGSRLYHRPYQKGSGITGDGLYLKSGNSFVPIATSGLITGNSHISAAISNVPLIGPLLSMII